MGRSARRQRFQFMDVGFHGDRYLVALANHLLKDKKFFVETGANAGTTLAYVAKNHPDLPCLSCEPDHEAHAHATNNTSDYGNVSLFHEDCVAFLQRLEGRPEVLEGDALYWLDAHGWGFEWPLREEIEFLTARCGRASLLIDDFQVPGLDCFGYDEYDGQVCTFDYIRDSFAPDRPYRLYYPSYTEHTSQHHPLRGWCLIELGGGDTLDLPADLRDKVQLNEEHSRLG